MENLRLAQGLYSQIRLRLNPIIYASFGGRPQLVSNPEDSQTPLSFDQTVDLEKGPGRSTATRLYRIPIGATPEVIIAHEFGHHLGLVDEYEDENCPKSNTDSPKLFAESHELSSHGGRCVDMGAPSANPRGSTLSNWF